MAESAEFVTRSKEQDYHRLTRRNTLFTLLVFIIPFILLLIFINFSLSQIIQNQVFNQLATMVEENAKIINLFLQDKEADFRSYGQLQIKSLDEVENLRPVFYQILKNKPWYDFIFVANLEGSIIFSTHNELIHESIASRQGQFFNSGIFYSDLLNQPAFILSQPLLNQSGEIIGILAVSLNLNYFYNLLFDLRIGETSELFLINSAGLLLSPRNWAASRLRTSASTSSRVILIKGTKELSFIWIIGARRFCVLMKKFLRRT